MINWQLIITMRAIKSFDTIFLCLLVCKFQKFLSQNKRPNFLSQWEQSKILTSYFLSLLSFDFSWSFSKKRGNHWWHFDAKTVIQHTPLKLIYFLTFDEASAKNWQKTFHESSVKNTFSNEVIQITTFLFCIKDIGIAGFWNGIPSLFRYRPALEYRPVTDFYGIPAEGYRP